MKNNIKKTKNPKKTGNSTTEKYRLEPIADKHRKIWREIFPVKKKKTKNEKKPIGENATPGHAVEAVSVNEIPNRLPNRKKREREI